jgi:ADP-ribosylglycohydrolase
MYGAISGDMIGAPYEFDRGSKTKDFPLFGRGSHFTDDSVMIVAVAEALLDSMGRSDDTIRAALVASMQKWGKKYPDAGYGGMFYRWLREKNPKPYGSFGNGSAMRVSAAGWLFDTLEETRHIARLTAEVTHNHPEGIKGAEAAASAIFMARNGSGKEEIREYIISEFGYALSRTCDEIRPGYHHVEICQKTVPEAITAFLEGEDFEDVIRTAVSLGGDCDTLTCIAGGIAEAYYGIPGGIMEECRKRLPADMLAVLDRFDEARPVKPEFHDMFLEGNDIIDDAISRYHDDGSEENLAAVLDAIRERMHADGHFIFPVIRDEEDANRFEFRAIKTNDGKLWHAAFTNRAESEKGAPSEVLSFFIDWTLKGTQEDDVAGIIINPWGQSFRLTKEHIGKMIEADGDVEYSVPDVPITAGLLEDGSFLRRAIEICNRNRTQLNFLKLARILRDSWVWIPCNAVFSDRDYEEWSKVVQEAAEKDDLDSLIGHRFVSEDNVRMIPDILQNGDDFYFPVFTSEEEMGEYGEQFSKLAQHFLDAMNLARNNEKNVRGIVINAFSEPFEIPVELFDLIARMESSVKE